jgi:hypothetical protein
MFKYEIQTQTNPETETELFPDETSEIINTMNVTLKIYIIRKLEKEIELFNKQLEESKYFYTDRIVKCVERIDLIKQAIHGYLRFNNLKNIKTPNGTAYQKDVTLKQWPGDDILLAWADAYKPEAVRIKREPDKKLIGEYIKATGETPDGYTESTETRLYIK